MQCATEFELLCSAAACMYHDLSYLQVAHFWFSLCFLLIARKWIICELECDSIIGGTAYLLTYSICHKRHEVPATILPFLRAMEHVNQNRYPKLFPACT